MSSFLDGTGLGHLIEKIKAAFVAKADTTAAISLGIDTTPTANSDNLITSGGVKAAIDELPEPMIFKGSLGTGGTITSLPTASSSNDGYTYKVITAGTYASQSAKVGDTFISDGTNWVLIPSGDEPSGTVTSITISATAPIAVNSSSAITTSGTRTISHNNSGVTAGTYKSVTVDAKGHVTDGTNPTTLSGYGITDANIDNGVITLGSNTITPLTSHQSLSNYVTLDGTQNITGEKTFVGNKKVKFKQSSSTDKLGFTGYNTSNAECGNFEILPNDRAVNLGIYSPDTKPSSDWLVGFKYQAKDSAGTVHKFGLRVPPRFGTSTYTEYYLPVKINNVTADNTGNINISIPNAPGTLDTTATTTQSTNASEALSGAITLHKVSKTGTYSDLLSKPDGEDFLNDINTFITNGGVTSISGTTPGAFIGYSLGYNVAYTGITYYPDLYNEQYIMELEATGEDGNALIVMSPAGGIYMSDTINDHLQYNNEDVAFLDEIPTNISDLNNDAGYLVSSDIADKADKVSSPTNGNFAALDSNGNLTDSGHKHSDYLTSFTETDPIFTASAAHGISSSDISAWNSKSTVTFRQWTTT